MALLGLLLEVEAASPGVVASFFNAIWSWIGFLFSWLLTLLLWAFAAALFGVWWCQGLLLYLPNHGTTPKKRGVSHNPQNYISPEEYQMAYEELYLRSSEQVRVHAWFITQAPERASKAPTVVLLHGNAGNIGFRLPLMRKLYDALGCNILALEYRGYGNSEGTPSESGLAQDARAAIEWLMCRPGIDHSKIFLYGQSLGGAVAIKTGHAFQEKLAGVMVENTFTSIDDMVMEIGVSQFRWQWIEYFRTFFAYFLTSHWASIRLVPDVRIPILFLSGLRDELIPPAQMQRLHESARSSSLNRMVTFATGTHNDTHYRGGNAYYRAMAVFMEDALKVNAGGKDAVTVQTSSNQNNNASSSSAAAAAVSSAVLGTATAAGAGGSNCK